MDATCKDAVSKAGNRKETIKNGVPAMIWYEFLENRSGVCPRCVGSWEAFLLAVLHISGHLVPCHFQLAV